MTADDVLRAVHLRLGGGVDIQTYSAGAVEVRWRRDYGGEVSEERFASAPTLVGALQAVLAYEDEADAADAREESRA